MPIGFLLVSITDESTWMFAILYGPERNCATLRGGIAALVRRYAPASTQAWPRRPMMGSTHVSVSESLIATSAGKQIGRAHV